MEVSVLTISIITALTVFFLYWLKDGGAKGKLLSYIGGGLSLGFCSFLLSLIFLEKFETLFYVPVLTVIFSVYMRNSSHVKSMLGEKQKNK